MIEFTEDELSVLRHALAAYGNILEEHSNRGEYGAKWELPQCDKLYEKIVNSSSI